MGNSWFQFQQFRINQDRCAMKISTDAILLGSLLESQNPKSILDIGTGTGVISLMLAQRFLEAKIQAVEIDEDAAKQAEENFKVSPFAERISLFQGRFQDFCSLDSFDLIVSNPPYFPDHLKSHDLKRNKALHTDELSFEDLAENASKLLNPSGRFWVILPPRQMSDFRQIANSYSLFLNTVVQVHDRQDLGVLREIGEFSFQNTHGIIRKLVLKEDSGEYSMEYKKVLSGFLLGY
ncbi:tRNA1Val (adenine37-N6)-methyltransferase [Algoriphagus boseongensis]|uniref:tRNA1(Val) (adenine(37)-N6)-methyltransferase n=1 Tax=Algoriphagus boseongensis TaxID=1442587 RepID=A0A4R6T503_9BACT|nr:methyltransferase [Algoriphagus boseongensis]TDQ17403.1 tRNA1Val (adenine37-N6)-methyltransferase [Algoriphagus boseongensis]